MRQRRQRIGASWPRLFQRKPLGRKRQPCRASDEADNETRKDALWLLTFVAWILTIQVVILPLGIWLGRKDWGDLIGPVILAVAQWVGIHYIRKGGSD